MDREKILELAKEADPFGEDGRLFAVAYLTPETLERFAALIEREVRGDAEPTAWIWWKDAPENNSFQTGLTFLRPSEDQSPSITWTPLYTDPPFPYPSHSAVRELVDALEDLLDEQNGAPLLKRAQHWEDSVAKARAAIAKATGRA